MNDESSLFLQTLKNVKRRAFLLAQLTNTINTIHKRSGCKSENICVIISEKKKRCEHVAVHTRHSQNALSGFSVASLLLLLIKRRSLHRYVSR